MTLLFQIYEIFERKSSHLLVMEKPANCIDLFEYSRKHGALDEKTARKIFKQVVETCIELLDNAILHRDIKDENILINEKTFQVKEQGNASLTQTQGENHRLWLCDRVQSREKISKFFRYPRVFSTRSF